MKKIFAGLISLILWAVLLAPSASAQSVSSGELLGFLIQTSESNSSTYKREAFIHWIDQDRDGCDTREEVLIAESQIKAKTGSGCSIIKGRWFSAYDNKTISSASGLDIDHMVPLKEAWESGASAWTAKEREAFANDLDFSGSLIAVSASSNRSKSDRDPGQWIPQNRSFRCEYAVQWIAVKYRWSLSADAAELSALGSMLASCSATTSFNLPQKVVLANTPSQTQEPVPTSTPTLAPTPTMTPTTSPSASPSPSQSPSSSPTPTPTPTPSSNGLPVVSPGAFCASGLEGTQGVGSNGTIYTCKRSSTDTRLRWRL